MAACCPRRPGPAAANEDGAGEAAPEPRKTCEVLAPAAEPKGCGVLTCAAFWCLAVLVLVVGIALQASATSGNDACTSVCGSACFNVSGFERPQLCAGEPLEIWELCRDLQNLTEKRRQEDACHAACAEQRRQGDDPCDPAGPDYIINDTGHFPPPECGACNDACRATFGVFAAEDAAASCRDQRNYTRIQGLWSAEYVKCEAECGGSPFWFEELFLAVSSLCLVGACAFGIFKEPLTAPRCSPRQRAMAFTTWVVGGLLSAYSLVWVGAQFVTQVVLDEDPPDVNTTAGSSFGVVLRYLGSFFFSAQSLAYLIAAAAFFCCSRRFYASAPEDARAAAASDGERA